MGPQASSERVVQFGKLMAALMTLKRKEPLSEWDMDIYQSKTEHVPLPILTQAVSNLLEGMKWFPTISEILAACETVRVEMRARAVFEPCEACERHGGWVEETDRWGVARMARCDCWKAHQAKVRSLGIPEQRLALPAGSDEE